MRWNDHSRLKDDHAFLGASKYHWIGYTPEKLKESYRKFLAVAEGTRKHAFAATCISMHQKLPTSKKTLNRFVNDAIGFGMVPEQVLYYSENCFGTADAIVYSDSERTLRIHDLKTGETKASMHQLEIYAALFCLEYGIDPYDITIILQIYQYNDVTPSQPEAEYIKALMDKIVESDKIISELRQKEGL